MKRQSLAQWADAKDSSGPEAEEATKYLEDAGMEIVTPSEQDYAEMRQRCAGPSGRLSARTAVRSFLTSTPPS